MGFGPPQNFFSILSLKMATFSAFWVLAHAARGAWPLPAPLDPPVTLGGPLIPQSTPFSTFYIAFHIFVAGGRRDVKFETWVDRIASASSRMTKRP